MSTIESFDSIEFRLNFDLIRLNKCDMEIFFASILRKLCDNSCSHFDPQIVQAFGL